MMPKFFVLFFPIKVPSIGFNFARLDVCEGDSRVILVVVSDGINPESVDVTFSLISGTAEGILSICYMLRFKSAFISEAQDISPVMGVLTFPPESRVQYIDVPITDDTLVEADEQFIVGLRAVESVAAIGINSIEVFIKDNDGNFVCIAALRGQTKIATVA